MAHHWTDRQSFSEGLMIAAILLLALTISGAYVVANLPRRERTMAERAEAARWAQIEDISRKTHP